MGMKLLKSLFLLLLYFISFFPYAQTASSSNSLQPVNYNIISVLLDGSIHLLTRRGLEWSIRNENPLIITPPINLTSIEDLDRFHQVIVPDTEGTLFRFSPGENPQKLRMKVKDLADLAPTIFNKTLVHSQKNTESILIDWKRGTLLKQWSSDDLPLIQEESLDRGILLSKVTYTVQLYDPLAKKETWNFTCVKYVDPSSPGSSVDIDYQKLPKYIVDKLPTAPIFGFLVFEDGTFQTINFNSSNEDTQFVQIGMINGGVYIDPLREIPNSLPLPGGQNQLTFIVDRQAENCSVNDKPSDTDPIRDPPFTYYPETIWDKLSSPFTMSVSIITVSAIYYFKIYLNKEKKQNTPAKKKKKKNAQPTSPQNNIPSSPNLTINSPTNSSLASPPPEFSTESLPDGTTRIGSLLVTSKVLGKGSNGTIVFEGIFDQRPVAVKRVLVTNYEIVEREVSLLTQSDEHSNIIRYFCKEKHGDFMYIALEKCQATLSDVFEKSSIEGIEDIKEVQQKIVEKNMLKEIVLGIQHLHNLQIVHRDLKPHNVLINHTPKKSRVLISDFGMCKKLEANQISFETTATGTRGWRAPEIIKAIPNDTDPINSKLTKAVDIFSLGCLLYYVLTFGKHPFGEQDYDRDSNIVAGHFDLSHLNDNLEAKDLISRMIEKDPNKRPSTKEILAHPFFWSDKERLEFLQYASDAYEKEEKDSEILKDLEARYSSVVVGKDCWIDKLDKQFIDNLGKHRKYQSTLRDLLRLIRNKLHHYQDLPKDVQELVGSLPSGYLNYFLTRFPLLFITVYKSIENGKLRYEKPLDIYFANSKE